LRVNDFSSSPTIELPTVAPKNNSSKMKTKTHWY
jgi:hypothetical protein